VIHTGDVVAYCAQPRETSDLLRASGVHCLMGNCEESIGVGKLDCGCGFPEDSKCNEYSVNWYAHVTEEIKDRGDLAIWMAGMPRRIEFVFAGRRFAVVHGSPRNISEFVWPSTPIEELQALFEGLPHGEGAAIDGLICGHSGIPFASFIPGHSDECGRRLWLNAGVIGMPPNDGTTRGWYVVLTEGLAGHIDIDIKALDYDAAAAAQAIFARPSLVRGYADSLQSGIWPSHDILPLDEQMRTGEVLQEQHLQWEAPRRRQAERRSAPCWHLALGGAGLAALLLAATLARRRGGSV